MTHKNADRIGRNFQPTLALLETRSLDLYEHLFDSQGWTIIADEKETDGIPFIRPGGFTWVSIYKKQSSFFL